LLAFVLAAQVGLLVWAGTMPVAPGAHVYPTEYDLATDYDRFLGQRAEVSGEVVATDPLVVRRVDGSVDVRLTVRGTDVAAERGDRIRAFGVVEPNHTVRATTAYAVPQGRQRYAWTVSFLAGLWVLARIVRHWSPDTDGWVLVPSGEDADAREGRDA
jgi:hypothetical protein